MGLYSFQERFVEPILSGRKKHTIRAIRKNPDKAGNILHLYTGLRTKKAKLLMRAPCVKVEDIRIEMRKYEGQSILCKGLTFPHVIVDGIDLSADEKEALAYTDGFSTFAEMMAFWDGRLPFTGHIIHWRIPKNVGKAKARG
jgi:hypothetical protein